MSTVRVVFTKWGDRQHWEFDTTRLGQDEYGVWLGIALGCVAVSPTASFTWDRVGAMIIPDGEPWTAQFMASASAPTLSDYRLYVDIVTPPLWDGDTVRLVDLDLDVVVGADGSVAVADEDEFAEHSAAWNYPPDIVSLAERSCTACLTAVTERREPFRSIGWRWLAELGG